MYTSKDDFVGNRSISQVHWHRWEKGWCKLAFMFFALTMALLMVMWATPKTAAAQSDIIFSAPDRTVATSDVTVTVPISLSTPAGVTLAGFRVDLSYDATKLAVASCTLVNIGFCNSSTSGTILFNAANFSGIADGTIATIVFTVTTGATDAGALSMSLSQVLDTSLADLTSRTVAQHGSVTIEGGIEPGNCNSDSLVDAGDISALILEIFDGDGNGSGDAAGGTFAGSDGCDTNRDTAIDAGDISCLILLIFNGPDACTTTLTTAGTLAPAQLQVANPQAVDRGSDITAAISLTSGDQVVTAAVFAFTFAPQQFAISPRDADADGIPA